MLGRSGLVYFNMCVVRSQPVYLLWWARLAHIAFATDSISARTA